MYVTHLYLRDAIYFVGMSAMNPLCGFHAY
jgi:hypothetical protein